MAKVKVPGNAIIGQSGGPTAVINQSLVGVVEGLKRLEGIKKIYGTRHGVSGLTANEPDVVELQRLSDDKLKAIARTPAAALGSSRDKPDAEYCKRIFKACAKLNIRHFFYIGGNDSSDTCRIVGELAEQAGHEMACIHVPKTVDNDLVGSDHTPGYPSAARFVASAFLGDALDNASLPGVKINVVMGRHAGFLTAASALAKGAGKDRDELGPHLVYVPEVPFDNQRFLKDVERVYRKLGRCQIAVSEGIQDKQGLPIAATLVEGLERDAHGNLQLSGVGALGDALAEHVKKHMKVAGGKKLRVRADTFGYLQRCWPEQSPVDAREARGVGRFAAKLAARGDHAASIAIVRVSDKPYKSTFERIEIADVAAKTRHMPKEFIEGTCGVSTKFVSYAAPLVGNLPASGRL